MRLRTTSAALLLSLAARSAAAQAIRGVVLDSASRAPVPGVVVTLLDSSAGVLGRIITNGRGQFNVPSAASIQRLRLQRIGFRKIERPIQVAASGFTDVEIRMASLPTMLEPVLVSSNSRCPRRDDYTATYALLEQARAGLLATIVARKEKPAAMRVLVFDRTLDKDDRIASQTVRIDSGLAFLPFAAARPPANLVTVGFARLSDGDNEFFAPDADVLLSDAFAAAYCFRMVSGGRGRAGQVGLGFDPAFRPRHVTTISGALWIDTVKRALVDLEYLYRDLGRLADVAKPGGRVSFVEARPGIVLIDRWALRLPLHHADTTRGLAANDVVRNWFDPVETGAELALARWDDSVEWRGHLGTLRASVQVRGAPAVDRTFRLESSDYRGITDSAGTLLITELLPGPYRVVPTSAALAAVDLDFPSVHGFLAVRDSVLTPVIEAPTLDSYAFDHCNKERYVAADAPKYHLVIGRVTGPDAKPIADAGIRVKWYGESKYFYGYPKPAATGTDGRFELCMPASAKNAVFTVVVKTPSGETIVNGKASDPVTPLLIFVERP